MSSLKNFFKYIGILILICLGIVLITLAGMVLFRFSLFGYKYVSFGSGDFQKVRINQDFDADTPTDATKINKITVNSDNIGVEMKPWIEGYRNDGVTPLTITYLIDMSISANGFAKVDESGEAKVDVNIDVVHNETDDSYELVINVKSPNGFINYTNAVLYIYTPFTLCDSSVEFTDPAGIKVQSNETLHLSDVNITTTSGNVKISDNHAGANNTVYPSATIYVDNLNVETSSGKQTYERCGISNYSGKSTTGDMDFSFLRNGAITGNVEISSEYGKITFNDGVNIGIKNPTSDENTHYCKINGKLTNIKINTLYNTALTYKGNADYITIGSAIKSSIDINSSDARLNIGSIYSNSFINVYYNDENNEDNKSGRRTIKINYIECGDSLNLHTWNGAIEIGTLYSTNTDITNSITSESGNITINNIIGNFNVSTLTNGNIKVNQLNINNQTERENFLKEISTQPFQYDLDSKKALLAQVDSYINESHNINVPYEIAMKQEKARLEKEIQLIQEDIQNAVNANTDFTAKENEIINSSLTIKAKSGEIRLTNISCKVTTNIIDNGTSAIHAQFVEIHGDSIINSGSGNVYLYMPFKTTDTESTPYWIYAKTNAINSNNTAFFGANATLNSGTAMSASVISGHDNTKVKYIIVSTPKEENETENKITLENLKTKAVSSQTINIVTIDSKSGNTTIDTTEKYTA